MTMKTYNVLVKSIATKVEKTFTVLATDGTHAEILIREQILKQLNDVYMVWKIIAVYPIVSDNGIAENSDETRTLLLG